MKQVKLVKVAYIWHRGKQGLKISFPFDAELQQLARTIKDVKWSNTYKAWWVPTRHNIEAELLLHFQGIAILHFETDGPVIDVKTPGNYLPDHFLIQGGLNEGVKLSAPPIVKPKGPRMNSSLGELSFEHLEKVSAFKSWMRSKRYSESTIGTYLDALKTFLRFFSHKDLAEITNTDLINFNNDHILKNKLSSSFQNQVVNGVKLFFSKIENKQLSPELIHRPKRAKVLPNVLSKEEVKAILNAHNNIKHKAMLSLIYSCGLRCGELLRLKFEHVDSKRSLLIIKQAKGRKDRVVPLSDKIIQMLREYHRANKPEIFLFEGQTKGEPYDQRSLQQVLKQALDKAGIRKPVSLHWLRHSYATHLLENGTDLRYIQEILGHSSSKTTEIYTHVSNKEIQRIISPFDYL
jgi:integrase/recombinase XerD